MSNSHMGNRLYTILSPRTVVMLMVTGQKDLHMMAELYSRRIQESARSFIDADQNKTLLGVSYMLWFNTSPHASPL